MSFLKNIFSSTTKPKKEIVSTINWIPLTTITELEALKEVSATETVLIFKHSTRCGISRMVIKLFEKQFDESMSNLKVYYLDLLNYRDISDEVGYAFQVLHQSPQLLVIKNGIAVANASHYDISNIDLKSNL
ncbi:MAG: bacillithiol system protein YtxJ [Polaribacter sp.]|jgi:bacillithiol system protein YtxJ